MSGAPADLLGELTEWAAALCYGDIPFRTTEFARSQIISHLAGVRATLRHPLGRKLVATFGAPLGRDPARSAQALAALSLALEYDEVGYSGHPSASAVSVAIAHAAAAGLDGERLITAVVAANECAMRYQASTLLGSFFRGQSATYTHLIGTVAAYLHATGADADCWARAARLAFGILPTPVERALLCSDAKAFVAATPVRMALDTCIAATHGLTGALGVLEADDGVLARLSDVPLPEAVVAHLGKRWHTDTLSFKRFPASAYLQAPFECAERLAAGHGPFAAADIDDVQVDATLLTSLLDQKSAPHVVGADSATAALTFSAGYGIGTLLLTGGFTTGDLEPQTCRDPDRWVVADKVRVNHDLALTAQMLTATVPLGEALRQAGPRALELPAIKAFGAAATQLLDSLGPTEDTFEEATMAIGARIVLRLRDGTALTEEVVSATGMAGPQTAATHRELAAAKFLDAGGDENTLAELSRIEELSPRELTGALTHALSCAP